MQFSIREIAQALGGIAVGNQDFSITGAAEPADAGPTDLALAMDPKYAEGLARGKARAAILWDGADWNALGLEAAITVARPRLAMSGLTKMLDHGPGISPGIHPSAVIEDGCEIGEGAAIGPFVHIAKGTKIGANARISSHVSIGENVVIGDDALLLAGARICHDVLVGDRLILHPNAVIGGDGFSFVTPERGAVENVRETLGDSGNSTAQAWTRIHSLGGVIIGNDVEIGVCATVDRGTIRATSVGNGTKIDNLVQVGHNCQVGNDCLLCGQVGLAGSARIGNNVVLAGKVGVGDNIFVGDNVVAGGGSKLMTNVPAGRVVLGYPAVKMETHVEMYKYLRRLPRMAKEFAALQKEVLKNDRKD